jgi:hypothetical protein
MEITDEKLHSPNIAIKCLLLSAFAVFTLWGFWGAGVSALGFNFSIFLGAYLLMVVIFLKTQNLWSSRSILWAVPIGMVALSYSLYEEPFVQVVSIFVLPIAFATLCLSGQKNFTIGFHSLPEIVVKGWFGNIMELVKARLEFVPLFKFTKEKSEGKRDIIYRIIVGFGIAFGLLLLFIVPLLSSADQEFASRFELIIESIVNPLWELFSEQFVIQLICLPIIALMILSQLFTWIGKEERIRHEVKQSDSLVVGIVLCSVLAVYLVFISIQFERIWVDNLPIDFKSTERLVKSGFWQLLTLTCLNIVIFIQTYQRTNGVVQGVLSLFSLTSIMLLFSAAHRMGLYVVFYGFSVEKFFACYTVVYCGLMFALFMFLLITKSKVNIVHFGAGLCLWMYALASLMPVEQFIVIANVKLAQMHGTRLNLNDLSMLSQGIAPIVEVYGEKRDQFGESLKCSGRELSVESSLITRLPLNRRLKLGDSRWTAWIDRELARNTNKRWYEHSVSSILAKNSLQRMSEAVSCCNWHSGYAKHTCVSNDRSTNNRR